MNTIVRYFAMISALVLAFTVLGLPAGASTTSPPDDNPSDCGGPSHGWGGGDGGPGDCGDGVGGKPFDMINTYTGNLTIADMPVYYQSVGDAIPFVVYFNSQWPITSQLLRHPMPAPWTHSYNIQLVGYSDASRSGIWIFEGNGWCHWFLYNAADGSYTAPKGVFDKLETYGSGWKLTRADQHKLFFDSSRKLTSIQDLNGLTWTLNYTVDGNPDTLDTITDPAGRQTALAYTQYGSRYYLTSVTVPGGLSAAFQYTAYGTNYGLTCITDAKGDSYYFAYDGTGAGLVSRRDPANRQVHYEYVAPGGDRQVSHTWVTEYPSGSTVLEDTYYEYDGSTQHAGQLWTNVTQTKDGADRVTRHIHNYTASDPMHGTLICVVEDQGTPNLAQNWAFDPLFRLIRYRDSWSPESGGKAHRHFFYYNDADPNNLGRVVKYIDPENSDANPSDSGLPSPTCPGYGFTYDTSGNLTQLKTPQNRVTDLYYTSNRLTDIYVRDKKRDGTTYDHRTQFTYDATHGYQVASVIDAENHTTTFSYKANTAGWYLERIHPPLGGDVLLGTNALGDVTSVTDGSGHATSLQYDGIHRPMQVTYPNVGNGQKSMFLNWSCCGLDQVTDENGVVTKLLREHDKIPSVPSPKLWKVIEDYGVGQHPDGANFLNAPTEFTYDEVGNTTAVKDARNLLTDYDYDGADRLFQINYPNSTHESWTYRDDGRVYTHTDARGRQTTFRYDADDRLAGSGSYVAINYPNDTDVGIARDNDGLITSMTDRSGTSTAAYYDSGWLKNFVVNAGNTKTLAYDYTGVGKVPALTITPNSRTFSYVYDNLNRLSSVTNPDSVQNTLTYDSGSRLSRITRPGSYLEYQYNDRDWVTAVLNRKTDNSTILDIIYSYNDGSLWDNTGTPLKFTENFTGLGLYTYTLRYDWLARQTQETRTNPGGGTDYALVYDYDLVGNRLHRTVGGVTATYNYAANSNRLNSLTGGQDASFTYDDNGNMTGVSGATFGSKTLVYDDENYLTSITYGGVTDTFLYNALGQRYKAVYNGSPTRYLFNGDRVMEELDNNGAVLRRYTTASGSYFGPWLHLWQISDSSSRFPLYNVTGSVRRLVDATGTIQDVYSYDTFGKGGFVGGNPANPFRYGGAWGYMTDPSGLIQLGARRYWPEIGRFVQEDPIGGGNPYAYAGGNPITRIDPLGLHETTSILHNIVHGDGHSLQTAGQGAAAWADGFIPFWDPFRNYYDPCNPAFQASVSMGGATRNVMAGAVAATGLAGVGAGAEAVGAADSAADGGGGSPAFPSTPEEMDQALGQKGRPVPDKPDTPGRGKIEWTPDVGKVTFEQHPYQPGKHQGPHFHWNEPGGGKRHDFYPGDPFPWLK